ncbi:hypothetical protein EVB79_066 [Rhizobium phage RHph_N3_13]|nr:hypothetical protein EVB79_066 [Rhizobium phage RHph_N3_13]QIG73059.1 hypothetical protein EVB99_068 [Rhizobium phage RHph_N3_19]
MYKVKFTGGVETDEYITADHFSTYDRFITFYNRIELPRGNNLADYGMNAVDSYSMKGETSEVVAAFAGEHIFSVTKVDGLPFTQGQTGDTGEDI